MNGELGEKFSRIRSLFPHAGKVAYFNSASNGPFCLPIKKAIDDNVDLRLKAEVDDSPEIFAIHDQLRADYAGLIGAGKSDVGVALSTTFGMNIAAFGLPLKPGDEVLLSEVEFPAMVYIWRAAAEARGIKIKFVPSRNRFFDIEQLERSITSQTKVVSLSFVQYFNGFKNDLAAISEVCKEHGLWLVVDGIQGMGAEPVDVKRAGVDIFSSGCQKWMLAPQGCGFFYLSEEMRKCLSFPFGSWLSVEWKMNFTDLFKFDLPYFDSARRYEMGYYATLNLLGMKASVKIFQDLGIAIIQKHNHALIDRLHAFIDSSPHYTCTSSLEPKHRSSIYTFTCPNPERLWDMLLERKIIVSLREGAIRVSAHLFNNEEDIDRLISALEEFAR